MSQVGKIDELTFGQSFVNLGNLGNLDVIARVGTTLHPFYRIGNVQWGAGNPIGNPGGSAGTPSLITASEFGPFNFELAVPRLDKGFNYLWCNNHADGFPWSDPFPVDDRGLKIDSLSLIESNWHPNAPIRVPPNFDLVARSGDQLVGYWRELPPNFTWTVPNTVIIMDRPVSNMRIQGL